MKLTSLWKKLARFSLTVCLDRTPKRRRTRLPSVQPLEERRLLSITSDTSYRDLQDTTLVVGVEYGLLAGGTGQNLSATLVGQPAHGSIELRNDGTFQYTPDPGFTGNDHFKFRDSPDDARIQTAKIDVMTPAVWAKQPQSQPSATPNKASLTVSPMNQVSDGGEFLSNSDATGQGGTALYFSVSVSGVWPYTMVDSEVQDDTTTTLKDHQERAVEGYDYLNSGGARTILDGSATYTVAIDTHDNPGQNHGTTSKIFDFITTAPDQYQPWGNLEADALGTILVHDPKPCTCFCGCDPVDAPAKVDPPNGQLQLKTGPSNNGPGKMQLNQANEPHPIISADDTLSATVAGATSITSQLTLFDSSGNAVYTGDPIYYSTARATPGEAVRFAQQIDAGAFSTGAYQWSMAIVENYSSGAPVMRNYGGITTIQNLDNSPYGRGWLPANLDSLAIQSNGVSLADGNGNLYFFMLDNWDPQPSFITPDGLAGRATLAQNSDGTYTLTWNDGSSQQFNGTGQLVISTDSSGNSVSYTFNQDGALATLSDWRGTTSFNYTAGMLTSVVDFAGRTTSYTYSDGRVASVTLPDPGHNEATPSKTFAYDPVTGLVASYTDSTGTTSITYGVGRAVTRITHPDGTYETFNAPLTQALVDTSSGLGSQSDPAALVPISTIIGTHTNEDGHTSQYTADANGNTLTETSAEGNETAYTLTATGLVASMAQPPLSPGGQNLLTSFSYDTNNNLSEVDLPDGTKETWTFDQTWNKPTQLIDPAGRETDYTLDPNNGNVLTVTQVGQNGDPNLVTSYTYTPAPVMPGDAPGGLVASMVDPRGIETDYSYTSFGAVSSIVYAVGTPDQASVSMTYDQNENLARYTNELGGVSTLTFDDLDRLVDTLLPPPDPSQPNVRPEIQDSYNTLGHKTSEIDPLGRTTVMAYGAFGNLTQMQQPDPAGGTNYTITTYNHDNAGNLTSIVDPMQRVKSMGFDLDNRQTSLTLPNPTTGGSGGPTESVVLNALGFPVQQFDLDGGETDNTFNWRGQVLTSVGPAVADGQGGQVRPTETLSYNNDGQTLTDQNPLLATTQLVYDSFGRLTEEILPDPDGSGPLTSPTLHWGYDADSNVTSFQDASGNVYHYVYSARNQLIEEDDPSPDGGTTPGPVWHWVHDAAMQLTATIDPMNRETQFVRDGDGNVIQTIAPSLTTGGPGDASTTTFDTYDLDNEKTSETTPNGGTTTWQHDDLGRTTITTQPAPAVGEAAPVWQDFYNADSELTKVINPLGLAQTSTFNGLGQMTSQVSFAGVETAWTYNNLSEILTATVGTGSLAQTTTNTWDALGRETAIQDANGTTQMAFDLAGRMTSLTDPDNNQTVWTRDNLGRVTAEQNPSGTESFSYDTNSNLTKEIDFDGHERDFVFDDLNRETAEKWMDGATVLNTIATAYNADSQVTSTGDNFSAYAFGYNGQGDQTSVDNAGTPGAPHVVLASGYDTQGNRTSLAATINGTADFLNNYSFDALSRLRNITQQGQSGGNAVAPKSIYIGLDGVGDITELNYANTVDAGPQPTSPGYATLSYSATTGLLTGINDIANGTSIDNLAYTYDALARVSTFTSIDGTGTFGYDHTSQLVSATYTTAAGGHQPNNIAFTWDANGNNNASGNVVSPNNEVTNDGTFTYQFDANGNRTVRTRISTSYASDYKTTYAWDYRNRLTDVETLDNNDVLTSHVHYVYDVYDDLIEEDIDPNGGGTYTTKEQFALDVSARVPSAGNAPLEKFDSSGNLVPSLPDDLLLELVNGQLAQRFLNGPSPSGAADVIYAEGAVDSLIQPDVPNWLFFNNQGSPTDVVDSSGNLIDHEVYSPFGQVVYVSNAGVFVLQGFSGGFADANTGEIKFGERWYDPTATVWISVDPARFRAGDADLTRYAGNAAPNLTDPIGLHPGTGAQRPAPVLIQGDGALEDLDLVLMQIAGSDNAENEAERIALAIINTYDGNARFAFPKFGTDDRVKGYYCYEWAYAFEDAFNLESSGDYFTVKVEEATDGGSRVHYWVVITSKQTGQSVYVDDGFGNGAFVNASRPIPDGWEMGSPGDVTRDECNPPPALPARPPRRPSPPWIGPFPPFPRPM